MAVEYLSSGYGILRALNDFSKESTNPGTAILLLYADQSIFVLSAGKASILEEQQRDNGKYRAANNFTIHCEKLCESTAARAFVAASFK